MKASDLYWRPLGWTAALNEYMSRTSVDFVPGNVAVILVFCTFGSLLPFLVWTLPYIWSNYRIERDVILFVVIVFLVGSISAFLACLSIISSVTRFVIFRADGKGENSSQPPEPTTGEATTQDLSGLRVSGPFRLDGREELRFVSVPAAFMDGFSDLLFTANIDASTTFLGIRVASRAGTWRLAVPRLGADTRQLGTQYFGTRARPAVRLRYPHEDGQGHERVVLSFGSEAERAAFLRCL